MWELDYKESWVPKNWCFWTVVLEKTLEGPLDCKEIKPVHPNWDQSWVFIGRTDAEAETPVLWPPDAKNWLIWKDPDAGKDWRQEEKGMIEDWDGWMVSPTQWTWVLVNSRSWWWTGRPDMLQSMRSQRVRHDWVTELNGIIFTHIKKQRHYFADKGLSNQSYGFSSNHVWMWELDYKEGWALKNWCFQAVVLKKTLESPLDCEEIKLVNPKGNQPWIFIGKTDAEAEAPILWLPDEKIWLTGKDPDAGKDWRQKEKGSAEDEMDEWHRRLNGHEFDQTLGDSEGQGSLACCSPWRYKELDTVKWLNKSI